jgi:hypothetical protein
MREGALPSRWLLTLAWTLGVLGARLTAVDPEIRNLPIRGLQIGTTNTVVIEGVDLGVTPRLLLSCPSQQTLKRGLTDSQATFDVTLADDVQPGYYQMRLATAGGLSLPVTLAVDRFRQRSWMAAIDSLPIALSGVVNGGGTVETIFTGKAGDQVTLEVEASRLGSQLRPILHLYNAQRVQLAWSWPTPTLFGDTRLQVTLPADGTYTVAVHDAEYAPPGAGFFRLKVGQWSYVNQVYPPCIAPGAQVVELLGPAETLRLQVVAPQAPTVLPLTLPREGLWSGPRPFVRVDSRAEVVAQPGKVSELPAGRVGVNGRLLTPYGEDRYRVPVQPNSKVRLEVFAERYGSPLDLALIVRDAAGNEVARAEDGPGTLDPILEYTVPDKVTAIVVGVVDSIGSGGPRGVYRLAIDPEPPAAATSDCRLTTPTGRMTLAIGGRHVLPVWLERHGYQGRVDLVPEGLPPGIKWENAVVPAGAEGALVTITGSCAGPAITHWHGRVENGQERLVKILGHPLERLQPWMATELPLAPTAIHAADYQIDWRGLPADAGLVLAGKLTLPIKVTRPANPSVVRISLLTSQPPRLVNGQPDPSQALRLENAFELADKVNEGTVALLVPPQLSVPAYDVTLQADFLTPDKTKVQATAFAPVRYMAVRHPLALRLDGAPRFEVKLDAKAGATVEIKGQIERREGLKSDVTVTPQGLPEGVTAAAVTVKAGTTAFAIKVVLPVNFAPGEVRGLNLVAIATPDPQQAALVVLTPPLQVTLVVKAAGK